MIIKRLHSIILLCILAVNVFSNESAGGLLFTSSAEKVDKRTSMVLFADKNLKLDDSFNLSFDLSIWDIKQFGHIFRIINEQKKEVEFVFVNFYGIDNMYLDFHSPITHKSVQIPISKETIEQKQILHLDIHFDFKQDKASLKLNDSVYTCSPIGFDNPSSLQFAFGLYGLNLDVPQMLIRNLKIDDMNGKSYFFPLKESSGNFAYDESGKIKASVKNPEWVVNKHFYWESKSKFTIKDKAYITYDKADNSIIIINKDSVISYYPRLGNVTRAPMTNLPSGFVIVDAIYDQKSGKCLIFGTDSTSRMMKSYNLQNNLSVNFLNPANDRDLLHHNSFFSSSDNLYQFGGYGNFTYSDKFSVWNKDNLEWEDVEFSGDKITPRFYSASGEGLQPDEVFIFGGFGNETGKQEHVGHNLYDLYQVNLNENKIIKLWEFRETPKNEFIPGNNLVLSKDKNYFYALCFAHHKSNSIGYLQRFNLKNGAYDVVSDSIRITSEDMNTSVNLFFNERLNEYYAVVKEYTSDHLTKIQVYSILSPPILKSELERPHYNNVKRLISLLVIVMLMLMLLLYTLRILNKNRKKRINNVETHLLEHSIHSDNYTHKQSAVYLFGSFTAFDNKGKDISYRFSSKLRALFIIILLSTKENAKISTEKLTTFLWPDKDMNEAKNIRGVTINRLRNILQDMDGISLVHENSQWYFMLNDEFYCDYLEYSDIVSQLNNPDQSSYFEWMERFSLIIGKGPFLSNIQDETIEKYKSIEEEKIEIILRDYINNLYVEKEYKKIVQLSSTYFSVEPLNEEILEICLKSYARLGKKEEAKTFFNNYKKVYKLMTGEEYKKML